MSFFGAGIVACDFIAIAPPPPPPQGGGAAVLAVPGSVLAGRSPLTPASRDGDVAPGVVVRDENAAARATAEFAVGVHLDLPHTGEHRVRILWVDRQSGASGVRVSKQHSVQCWPPSVVRNTPRSCCGPVNLPRAQANTVSGL
jgi:hypothetical protein